MRPARSPRTHGTPWSIPLAEIALDGFLLCILTLGPRVAPARDPLGLSGLSIEAPRLGAATQEPGPHELVVAVGADGAVSAGGGPALARIADGSAAIAAALEPHLRALAPEAGVVLLLDRGLALADVEAISRALGERAARLLAAPGGP